MKELQRLLTKFWSRMFPAESVPRPLLRRPTRLHLEELEDRLAPATFNIANGDTADLIARIAQANANNQADTINLAPGGVYNLTVVDNNNFGPNGLPAIVRDTIASNSLTLNGNGATLQRSTAAGTPEFRILINMSGVVTLDNLTVKNGSISAVGFAASGGGLFNFSGTMTLDNCTVTGNNVATSGAGLVVVASGGGIFNERNAILIINNSTIVGNTVTSTSAVFTAGAFGGGIDSRGILTINNSTISGNAINSINGQYGGGGIGLNGFSSTTINNSTITNNADNSGRGGGGIRVYYPGTLNLRSTIVAGNTTRTPANGPDIRGDAAAASSKNLVGIGTALTGITHGVNGNMIGTAASPITPQLSSLANNGGPTQTHALAPTSPAVAQGQNFTTFTNDQRGTGFPRATSGNVDIGAVQRTTTVVIVIPPPIKKPAPIKIPARAPRQGRRFGR